MYNLYYFSNGIRLLCVAVIRRNIMLSPVNRKGVPMKLFIDTANVDDIRRANDMGIICGVTTNPSLIAKEGRDFKQVVKEITEIVDGPVSAEVISLEADKMVEEALPLAAIHKNIVIKLPMCEEGLKACKQLTAKGIKTNVTLVFSAAQALLAARAGATFVSPFLGRLDDIGMEGMTLSKRSLTYSMHRALNRDYRRIYP